MRYINTLLFLLLIQLGYSQAPKHSTTIEVQNSDFRKIVNNLLDHGFVMGKVDSNYQTVRTEFKICPLPNGKMSLIHISFDARIKHGITTISGRWYNEMFKFDEPETIKNGRGADKISFNEMDRFARTLGNNITYK